MITNRVPTSQEQLEILRGSGWAGCLGMLAVIGMLITGGLGGILWIAGSMEGLLGALVGLVLTCVLAAVFIPIQRTSRRLKLKDSEQVQEIEATNPRLI